MNMTMLGSPIHPKPNPENLCPAKMPPAATAISSIPQPADSMCSELASLKIGVRRCRISSRARITRLMAQLPKRVPTARSGEPTRAAALTPVTSSGMDVTAARSNSPIQIRPKPVFSPIASPYRTVFVPANRMMIRHRTNLNQTNAEQSYYIENKHIKHMTIAPYMEYNLLVLMGRGDRVVYGAALEKRWAEKCLVGSNPTLSAKHQ